MKFTKSFLYIMTLLLTLSCNGQKGQVKTSDTPKQSDSDSDYLFVPIEQTNPDAIPNDTFVPLFYEGQLAHWIRTINEDAHGNLWFGTNHYGVIRYGDNKLTYFTSDRGFDAKRVSAVHTNENGDVYFGTASGLTVYHASDQRFTQLTTEHGLVNNEIWAMMASKDGTLWIGTSEGISKYNGETFTTFAIPKSKVKEPRALISYDRITSIMEDSQGNLWFGTDGYGVCKFDGKNFTHYTTSDGLCDNTISDIFEDQTGAIWIGTMFGGVSIYNGSTFKNLTALGLINGEEAGGFYEDTDGAIWFAVEHQGVYKYQHGTFTNYNTDAGLGSSGIIAMMRDSKNRFWFGGWKGLFRFNGKSFDTITKKGPWD